MKFLYTFVLLFVSLFFVADASAKAKKSRKASHKEAELVVLPPQTSIVVDMEDGKILHAENPDLRIYPASLTKVMTLYLAFESIKKGTLSMDQMIDVSARAANMRPCKLGLKAGDTISVRDAIYSLIIRSANDSAVALGEAISGSSEDRFAEIMTKRAYDLGMRNTTFRNASGWHHPEHKTTAIDMAKLTMALKRDFPEYYPLFSETSFTFRGQVYNSHNRVVKEYRWAEGLKTGYTTPAGYNLITTAEKDGKRLVGVVTGGRTKDARNYKMVSLLDKHFGLPPSDNFRSENATFVSKRNSANKSSITKPKAKIQMVKAKVKKKKKLKHTVTAA